MNRKALASVAVLVSANAFAAPQLKCTAYFKFFNLFPDQIQTDVAGGSCSFEVKPGDASGCTALGDPVEPQGLQQNLMRFAANTDLEDGTVSLDVSFKAFVSVSGSRDPGQEALAFGRADLRADSSKSFTLDAHASCEDNCGMRKWSGDAYAHFPVHHGAEVAEVDLRGIAPMQTFVRCAYTP